MAKLKDSRRRFITRWRVFYKCVRATSTATCIMIISMTITLLFNFDKTFHTSFCFFGTSKLVARQFLICEGFEPRSHFISRFSVIVRVNVVLKSTIVVDSDWHVDNLCGSHLQSQSELYHISWCYYTLVIDPIGQFSCDVIGRLSVNWLWRFIGAFQSVYCHS